LNVDTILILKGHDVATIATHASVEQAVDDLCALRVGALVVSDDGRHVEGIISERDVMRALGDHGADALARPVSSVMSTEVVTCRAKDSVEELMVTMTEHRFRHLPVVDSDGLLVAIVSIGDVVKARLGQLELDNQALVQYLHLVR
jgi:CBS domain-containing protein